MTKTPTIVFLGDGGVGKTCLVEGYNPKYIATSGTNSIEMENCIITDTAGQEKISLPIPNGDQYVIVFDATSKVTSKNIPSWVKKIRDQHGENAVIHLVKNKIDSKEIRGHRIVGSDENGKIFTSYHKVSTKTGEGLVEFFTMLNNY